MNKIQLLLKRFKMVMQTVKTLDLMKLSEYKLIAVPFNGMMTTVITRQLSQIQIMSCGNFSLIETFEDKIRMKAQLKDKDILSFIAYAEKQHEICKFALVSPTYDQIIETVTSQGIKDSYDKIDELKAKLKGAPAGPERNDLNRELDIMRIQTDLILPTDFTASITADALGTASSDIKLVTNEILLRAAILAESGHDNPADHISGNFKEFHRDDINIRARQRLHEERKNQKPKRRKK